MGLRVAESLERRHPDKILGRRIEGTPAAIADVGAGCAKEELRVLDAGDRIKARRRLRVVVIGQPVDLLDVEDRVALEERDLALDVLA